MTPQDAALLASLTGFTPGPWKLNPGKNDWLGGFYANDYAVCTFGCDTMYYPTEGEAPNHWNAALIAAAPDLHRIATEQAAEIERLRDVCNDLAAVIAYIDAHVPRADKSCVFPGVTFSECARAAATLEAGQ